MSYILDALRRADAERERGAIPGLHSQSFPTGEALDARPGQPPWVWVLLGMCVVLLAAVLWLWLGGAEKPEPRVALAPLPVTSAEQAPAAATSVAPAMPATVVAQASAPVAASRPAAKSAPAIEAEASKARPKPAPAAVAKTQRETRASVTEPVVELKAPPFSALPESLRRELPSLMVGGSVYAKTPANRILILNGQPFHEGDSPMSELVLEQIKLKSAVLKYKGQRFELSY
jgi:general secretion pathway protein B